MRGGGDRGNFRDRVPGPVPSAGPTGTASAFSPSRARAAFTQRKHRSGPNRAKRTGASSVSMSTSAASEASRCLGTEVSMLTTNTLYRAGGCHRRLFPRDHRSRCQPIKRATVRQLVRPGVRIRGSESPSRSHFMPDRNRAGVARLV